MTIFFFSDSDWTDKSHFFSRHPSTIHFSGDSTTDPLEELWYYTANLPSMACEGSWEATGDAATSDQLLISGRPWTNAFSTTSPSAVLISNLLYLLNLVPAPPLSLSPNGTLCNNAPFRILCTDLSCNISETNNQCEPPDCYAPRLLKFSLQSILPLFLSVTGSPNQKRGGKNGLSGQSGQDAVTNI